MPRHIFTDDESAKIAQLRDKGTPWQQIADALGVTTSPVRNEYERVLDQRFTAERVARNRPAPRRCLGGCGQYFESSGAGHRMCDGCAGRSVSPFEPESVPGRQTWQSRAGAGVEWNTLPDADA